VERGAGYRAPPTEVESYGVQFVPPGINGEIHCACAGSVRQVLEGLKPGGSYRYGDTSVSPGSTKSGGFSCLKCHAVNIVSLAHSWWGKPCLRF
jgi:hypothetical protein